MVYNIDTVLRCFSCGDVVIKMTHSENEMFYVGIDACKAGWFAVSLESGSNFSIEIFSNISGLWDNYHDAKLILIDIPIGLRESGLDERLCDKEARRLLGKRGSSVFPAPCRAAVYANSYEEASLINEKNTGRKLSQQIWNIIPKIKQVDN